MGDRPHYQLHREQQHIAGDSGQAAQQAVIFPDLRIFGLGVIVNKFFNQKFRHRTHSLE